MQFSSLYKFFLNLKDTGLEPSLSPDRDVHLSFVNVASGGPRGVPTPSYDASKEKLQQELDIMRSEMEFQKNQIDDLTTR